MPAQLDLVASRNVTWAPTLNFNYTGPELPLNGAHIAMQLRFYPAAAGDAFLTINPIPFTDSRTSPIGEAEERVLTLEPHVSDVELMALPSLHVPDAGVSSPFSYDIRITYADGVSELLSKGLFIVEPGVTTV